jgi:two-component system, NarL family, nitrate/nitrite response regulator NarL
MTIRIALVDDHPVVLGGLEAALGTISDVSVVATGVNLAEGRLISQRADVDVILLDVRLPDGNGLELVSEIAQRGRPAVIMLSSFKTKQYVAAALRFGAQGFLLKTVALHELINAIRVVAAGGSAFTAEQLRDGRSGFVSLSLRERQILRLILKGRSNEEIGAELRVSHKTVEAHLGKLYERLGITSRIELVLQAEHDGWLDIDGASV